MSDVSASELRLVTDKAATLSSRDGCSGTSVSGTSCGRYFDTY